MVETLEVLIDDFPGAANQTCCFLHILNLVVKSILKQFDLLQSKEKKESGDNSENKESNKTMDWAAEELLKLAGNVDIEGDLMLNDEEDDDSNEGWIVERGEMTEDELRELSASVALVRLLLTKVRLRIKL